MITSKRDIDTFRNIAKLCCKQDRTYANGKLALYITIDSFNYETDSIVINIHPYNDKYSVSLNHMLSVLQSHGIYKDYSIDRTTHIYKNDRERAFRKTSIAEEI
jgi:hypothetical protein